MSDKRLVVAMILLLAMVITSCKPAEKLAKEINLNLGTERRIRPRWTVMSNCSWD